MLRKAQCQYFTLKSLQELCIRFWLVLIRRCYPWLIPERNNSFFVWRGRQFRQEERWTEINPACDTPPHSAIIPSTSHTGSLTVYTVFRLCLLAQGNVYFYGSEPEVGINKLTIWFLMFKAGIVSIAAFMNLRVWTQTRPRLLIIVRKCLPSTAKFVNVPKNQNYLKLLLATISHLQVVFFIVKVRLCYFLFTKLLSLFKYAFNMEEQEVG